MVEDDDRVGRVLELTLAAEGYDVVRVATGEAGLEAASHRAFDVVLLDLLLPGASGFEVCRELRRTSDAPVLMVTARSDSHDVVAGLEAGADDYVSKPFVPQELSARVRALLRRAAGSTRAPRVRVGSVEVDAHAGVALRDGEPLALTRTEFRLLCELAAEPGRVLSREDLLERVWGYDYLGDARLVDTHVGRLRRKVEVDPGDPQVVLTVRGMGYRLGA